MEYGKLIKYCLQYLEQDSDTDVMNTNIRDLREDSIFAEYIINIESSLYTGIIRLVQSEVIPIKEKEFPEGSNTIVLVDNKNRRLFHSIKQVYCEDSNGNIGHNVDYFIIGSKIKIRNYNSANKYYVIYHPTIYTLDNYIDTENNKTIYDIELNCIGDECIEIPDEMAINLKYLVYGDMKIEENPSVATQNTNKFEAYLDSARTVQIDHAQVKVIEDDWCDTYATNGGGYNGD